MSTIANRRAGLPVLDYEAPDSLCSTAARGSGSVAQVAVPLPLFQTFSYRIPRALRSLVRPGCRVLVPFGRSHLVGLAVGVEGHQSDQGRSLKNVTRVLDTQPLLTRAQLELGLWVSTYYFAPPGECFRVMLPPRLLRRRASPSDSESFWPVRLQLAVVDRQPRSPKLPTAQARAWQHLGEYILPVPLATFCRTTGSSRATLHALKRRGLIEIRSIELYRSPWLEPAAAKVRHKLTAEQQKVLGRICDQLNTGFSSILLHGVTGSGKTEIYLNAIEETLKRGRSALVLVPEIGLTPQISSQFRSWFGRRVAILHSALSDGERFDQWQLIRRGSAQVVVGTRSAVFAPLQKLGLIIVDEEHDGSYKQDDLPRYHGRDAALKRAQLEQALVVLGSATPQLESYFRAVESEKSVYQELSRRVGDRPLPTVQIVDMRVEFEKMGKATALSQLLMQQIELRLRQEQQVLLLLNRRGYSSALLCRSCGYTETCENCSISLTFHQNLNRLMCHYCGYTRSVPKECSQCGKEFIYYRGLGTEQLQELVEKAFPQARVNRMDRDTVQRKGSYERILGSFRTGQTDILVGTQMIAKGHDFPGVTLVGVLGADQNLRLADFRSAERTFQLLTQVAGRAGRGDRPGDVIIQTYYPNHYSLKCACAQDYLEFYQCEIRFRRRFRYPPFTALANLLVRGSNAREALELAHLIADLLLEFRQESSSSERLRVLGPASAPVERIKGDYRFQILIKTTNRGELFQVLRKSLDELKARKMPLNRISVDIDPLNLL